MTKQEETSYAIHVTPGDLSHGVHVYDTRDMGAAARIDAFEREHRRVPIYDGNEHVCADCPRNFYGELVGWDQAHPKSLRGDA